MIINKLNKLNYTIFSNCFLSNEKKTLKKIIKKKAKKKINEY